MGFFDRLVARDQELADTKYQGRESATDRAGRLRREKHRARVARGRDQSGQPRRRFFS
ncbi:hypothetical protein ACFXJ6_08175 [Streptomyces sp. NPDC059218]|uniref:hypothetical protein n=1 Tax=unclassified Streptomyces TaxID=2593676 RepID=UPI00369C92D2